MAWRSLVLGAWCLVLGPSVVLSPFLVLGPESTLCSASRQSLNGPGTLDQGRTTDKGRTKNQALRPKDLDRPTHHHHVRAAPIFIGARCFRHLEHDICRLVPADWRELRPD